MGGNVKGENEDPEISPLVTNGWSTLGYKVQSIVNTTSHLHYMLGSIVAAKSTETLLQGEGQKIRKTYAKNDNLRPTTEAKVLDFKDKNSTGNMRENMTDVLVESTYEQLVMAYKSANKEPVCYYSFILDPTNFGATVENMFYTSFLIKEGKAR